MIERKGRKKVLLSIICFSLLMVACTGDSPSQSQALWISDVCGLRETIETGDGYIPVYVFGGIKFIGDMKFDEYILIVIEFEHELHNGEEFSSISNYRRWPESSRRHLFESEDVLVRTCKESEGCLAGRFWSCKFGTKGIEIIRSGIWIV